MPKKLEEDFLLAAATNDVARLKKLLRQGGIDVNYMDEVSHIDKIVYGMI